MSACSRGLHGVLIVHGLPLAAELLRWWLLGNFAMQLVLEWAKGLAGHKREMRAGRVKAYWEVLRSGLRG